MHMKFVPPIENLHDHLLALAQTAPERIALKAINEEGDQIRVITYKELERLITVTAGWLHAQELQKGDVLALAMKNSVELLVISWAAWASGIVTAPLDTKKDTIEEHKYKVGLVKAKCVIAEKGVLSAEVQQQLKIPVIEVQGTEFAAREFSEVTWKKDLSHLALILFTSGTTSLPKGAQLSLQNLIANADGIREWFQIQPIDAFMVNLPLHHINSTTFCLATLLSGATIIIPPSYSNSRFFKQAAKSKATFTSVVQSIIFDQLFREKEYQEVKDELILSRMQIGSAPVVVSDAVAFMQKYNIPLYQGYGQTETALRVTGVPLDLPSDVYEELVRENAIGKPMKWAEVGIADETGKLLSAGEEGELVVKGPIVMQGYIGDIPAFRNGYFLTGDIGYFKEIKGEKYFFLKGRKKEILIKGGINISPVAVEDKLKKVSGAIAQVYVVGIADERYGEEVGAVVVWKKGVDEVREKALLKKKLREGAKEYISSYETPQYLATLTADKLPVTSTGKVQRSVLKKNLLLEDFESIYEVARTNNHQFLLLSAHSPFFKQTFALYNQTWDPLTIDLATFKKQQKSLSTIIAVGKGGALDGYVSFLRANASGKVIASCTYKDLVEGKITDKDGKHMVCVAIGSAKHVPEPLSLDAEQIEKIPSPEEVKVYFEKGLDSVYNFHTKPKGGFSQGAQLVQIIPNGRPEDRRALGYNMLMQYPSLTQTVTIDEKRSIATQLIEAVMVLAQQEEVETIFAYSRPGGLADYIFSQLSPKVR